MCGIFGWSFKKKARVPVVQAEVLATTLALANSQRGTDSWGVYLVDWGGKHQIHRKVGDIASAKGISGWGSFPVVMAHTRAATTGAKVAGNAHPFQKGNLVLAHNGIVFNHDELQAKYNRFCQVDSEQILWHLVEDKPMEEIEGYGSVEYADTTQAGVVKLCRMQGGSLAVYGVRDDLGNQIGTVWSSDEAHLQGALGAARLECFPYKKLEEGAVYHVKRGVLYTSEERIDITECNYRAWLTNGPSDKWWKDSPGVEEDYVWLSAPGGTGSFRQVRPPQFLGDCGWVFDGELYKVGEDGRFYNSDGSEVLDEEIVEALENAWLGSEHQDLSGLDNEYLSRLEN